ncbi:MAG: nucleotidyl transferase AbiEii/AbiGii toxin family protein [Marinifilum sp.]|jgi:predicted nucleotidyltransferase component of viral defense system|nr:nucleotidyl transferase AbiEii/AbiGii toxin family protein [Marinifilum sp.]
MEKWDSVVEEFIQRSTENGVRMIMVGGGAVNFHGFQRHSADIDFWIDLSVDNLIRLKTVLNQMGYEFDDYPEDVKKGLQNISIKISPVFDLELITKFNPDKSFEDAFNDSVEVFLNNNPLKKYNVLAFEDLISSKIKAGRPKDLIDVNELKRLNKDTLK